MQTLLALAECRTVSSVADRIYGSRCWIGHGCWCELLQLNSQCSTKGTAKLPLSEAKYAHLLSQRILCGSSCGRQASMLHGVCKPLNVSCPTMQEVESAADVQRNLTAAIAALEELEQHQNPRSGPTVVRKGTCVPTLAIDSDW